jgi:hypothetical protein
MSSSGTILGKSGIFLSVYMMADSFLVCFTMNISSGAAVPVVFEQAGSVGGTWVYTDSVGIDDRYGAWL